VPGCLDRSGFAIASRLLCLLMAVLALGGQVAVGSVGADRLAAAVTEAGPLGPMCGSAHHAHLASPVHPERLAAALHLVAVLPSEAGLVPLVPVVGAWLLLPSCRVAAFAPGLPGARAPPPRALRPQPRGPPSSR
jgi:hypothetical protein